MLHSSHCSALDHMVRTANHAVSILGCSLRMWLKNCPTSGHFRSVHFHGLQIPTIFCELLLRWGFWTYDDVNGRLEHGHRLFVSCECLIKICYNSLVDFAQNGRGGTRNCEINRIYLTNTKQFTELCSRLDFKGTKKSPPAGLWMRLERKQSTRATL